MRVRWPLPTWTSMPNCFAEPGAKVSSRSRVAPLMPADVVPVIAFVGERLGRAGCRACSVRAPVARSAAAGRRSCPAEFAGDAVGAAPRVGGDVAGVVPVVHPADQDLPAAGDVVEHGGGVEVRAVVGPVRPLRAGQRRRGGELNLSALGGPSAAAVLVDDLDLRLLALVGSQVRTSPVQRLVCCCRWPSRQPARRRADPARSRCWRAAASLENTMLSTLRCPHPCRGLVDDLDLRLLARVTRTRSMTASSALRCSRRSRCPRPCRRRSG